MSEPPLDNATFLSAIPAQAPGNSLGLDDLWAQLGASKDVLGEGLSKLFDRAGIANSIWQEFSDHVHSDLRGLGSPDLSSLTAAITTASSQLIVELNRENALLLKAWQGGPGDDALPGQSLYDLARNTDWGKSAGWSGLIDLIAKLLPGAGPALEGVLDAALGPKREHSAPRRPTLGESVWESLKGVILLNPVTVGAGVAAGTSAGRPVVQAVADAAAAVGEVITGAWSQVTAFAEEYGPKLIALFGINTSSLQAGVETALFPGGPTEPEQAFGVGRDAMVRASLAGVAAHAVSALLSAQIVGTLGINATGLAAMVGEFAGFGPIVGAMRETWADAAIRVPWERHINERFRPWLPGLDTVMQLEHKGIIDAALRNKLLGYLGVPADPWIGLLEDNHQTEPPIRYLADLADQLDAGDDWWEKKLRRLEFGDADRPLMKAAMLRRRLNSQYTAAATTLVNQFLAGQIDQPDLEASLDDLDLPADKIGLMVNTALARRSLAEFADWVAEFDAMYATGQLDDDGYLTQLNSVFAEPAVAARHAELARVKRYKKVALLTPTQEAASLVSAHRQLFLDGTETAAEYEGALRLAGIEDPALSLTLTRDRSARDKAISAQFRAYQLPAARDAFVHGLVTEPAYRQALLDAKFPGTAIAAELALVKSMKADRVAGQVRVFELPAYEEAFYRGLIPASQLRAVRKRAGLNEAAITAAELTDSIKRKDLFTKALSAAAKDVLAKATAAATAAKKLADATAAWDKAQAKAAADQAKLAADQAAADLTTAAGQVAALPPGSLPAAAEDLIAEVQRGMTADPDRLVELATQLLEQLSGP